MAIVIKPPLFPRYPCREAIPLHMVCQDLYSVFKVLSFGTIILYQTFSDLSRGLLKIFLGNFYQSLNLKEVCILVVLPPGVEPGWHFCQRLLRPLCSYQFHHGSINGAPSGIWTQKIHFLRVSSMPVRVMAHIKFLFTNAEIRTNKGRLINSSRTTTVVGQVGVEPTVFLTSWVYSPLQSPLCTLTHIIFF